MSGPAPTVPVRHIAWEEPTAHLRLVHGVLQQQWKIKLIDQDTSGACESDLYEWRSVQEVTTANDPRTNPHD